MMMMALLVVVSFARAQDLMPEPEADQGWKVIAWNDLGMHCLDEDFSVFAILPPYNTLNAQVVNAQGERADGSNGVQLYYEAVVDPNGSATMSSEKVTNFWQYAQGLFQNPIEQNTGLTGNRMPGANNTPQLLHWDANRNWWIAEGIPMVPTDASGMKQHYPLVRVTARDVNGRLLGDTRVVLPVSDEMNCLSCHQSGGSAEAQPTGGWVNDSDPVRDYRLNILRKHDARLAWSDDYKNALSALGYSSMGLEATVKQMGRSILCANCHSSNALGTTGQPGVSPLTQAIHGAHAGVLDPQTGQPLGASTNRSSCYQCHPGQDTLCLRGAMGNARDASGQLSMSCQSCHGGMSQVASSARSGWFDEPSCQSCHTGTESNNSGKLRFLTSLTDTGTERQAADTRFATEADQPAAGFNLYRFSRGHGGLYCSACHGSPHAIYPSHEVNDNLQNIALQGHAGTLADCSACHETMPTTTTGGPHGMHSVGNDWVERHGDLAEDNSQACAACHGTDYRGGVLSRTFAARSLNNDGHWEFFKGQQVGCYDCHSGPDNEHSNSNARPVATGFKLATLSGTLVSANLEGSDADSGSLSYRIVTTPKHGELVLDGSQIAYTPEPGYTGTDYFEYCARDDYRESNLALVPIEVGADASMADLDDDGVPDLVERALGMSSEYTGRHGYSRIRMKSGENGSVLLQAIYDSRLIPPDLEVIVQVSEDMKTWSSSVDGLITFVNGQGMTVTSFESKLDSGTRQFMRLFARQVEP